MRRRKDQDFKIDWEGLRYHGNLRHLIDRYVYFRGGYALHEIALLRAVSQIIRGRKGSVTMLDIGANVGQHSLALHRYVDKILAFEPNPEVAARLRLNIERNAIENIELHEVALSDVDETGTLGSGLDGNDGSRSLNWSLDSSADISVPVREAEAYLAANLGDDESIDLIKIDVEGHESKVLGSLSGSLKRNRPVILFELVGQGVKGGFHSLAEVRAALYLDHTLMGVIPGVRPKLSEFDWQIHEEALCIPNELLPEIGKANFQ